MISRVLVGGAENIEGTINEESWMLINVYRNNSLAWADSGHPSHFGWGLVFPPVSDEARDHPFEHLHEYPPANRAVIEVTNTQFSFDGVALYVYDNWNGDMAGMIEKTIHIPASPGGTSRYEMTFGDYSAFLTLLPVLGLLAIPAAVIIVARARR